MKKTINIFKSGRHTAMSGQALQFSDTDLHKSAIVYNPKVHAAPLVLGHPATDAPAYGQVLGLKAQGSLLYADVDASDELVGLVRKGSYIRVSASFYSPQAPNNPTPGAYYLRHVGFLGATPPAVKGLEPPSFAASRSGALCFSEGAPLPPNFTGALPTSGGPIPNHSEDPEGFNAAVLAVMKVNPALTYQQALGQVLVAQARQQQDKGMATQAAPDRMQLHMRVRQVQQQDPSLSYAEALNAVHIF